MLAHNVDFYPDDPTRFARQVLEPVTDPVPRAKVTPTPAGLIMHDANGPSHNEETPDKVLARFYHISLGDPEDLPKPEKGVYLGVSAITIQAVMRMNDVPGTEKRPTGDLLCLYDEVWQNGERLGVRGLSRPLPVRHEQSDLPLLGGVGELIEATVHNACPYGVALYSHDAPNQVEEDHPVLSSMPGATNYMAADHTEVLLEDLSSQLGIPVYETAAKGARNLGQDNVRPDELWIASPNVPVAAGVAAVRAGVIVQAKTVRANWRREHGVVTGGRGYAMLDNTVTGSFAI
jgi:hypothetical protein